MSLRLPPFSIQWDTVKAETNITKHGVAFTQAATVLLDSMALTVFDASHSVDEERWFTLGVASDGRLLAVSHTYNDDDPEEIRVRIISARPATAKERAQYQSGGY